ncbi:MAG: hypothetical protein SA339_05070 [Methanomassiliicoccus sp.]|nr:hypothetical protein [Methanomassiliicoccus sp.]
MKGIEIVKTMAAFLILACLIVPGVVLAQPVSQSSSAMSADEKAILSEKPIIKYQDKPTYLLGQSENTDNIIKGLKIGTSKVQPITATDYKAQIAQSKGVVVIDANYLRNLSQKEAIATIREILVTGTPVIFYGIVDDLIEKVGLTIDHANWPVYKNATVSGMMYWPTNKSVKSWSSVLEADSIKIKDQLKAYRVADLYDWANGLLQSSNVEYGPITARSMSDFYQYATMRNSASQYPYGKGNADVFCRKYITESNPSVDWYVYTNELSITPGRALGWSNEWYNYKLTNSDDVDYLSSHSNDMMYSYGPQGTQTGGTVSVSLGTGGPSYSYSYAIPSVRVVCLCVPGDDYARWDHFWDNPSNNGASSQTNCEQPGWTVQVPQGGSTFVDERVEFQFADYVFGYYTMHNIPDAWVTGYFGPGAP